MNKNIRYIIAIIIALITIYTTNQSNQSSSNVSNTSKTEQSAQSGHFNIHQLQQTENFNRNALEHIFYGSINRNGNATGFHFEETGENAKIIENTRSKKDSHGVYRASVIIEGIKKSGYSSFFPEEWQPQEVVDAINIAYANREHISGNTYEGKSHGITIQMYLADDEKIISAFPIYKR